MSQNLKKGYTEKGDYMEYYNLIAEAILNDKKLPVSANEAKNVIKIIEAALLSNEEKRVVDLS